MGAHFPSPAPQITSPEALWPTSPKVAVSAKVAVRVGRAPLLSSTSPKVGRAGGSSPRHLPLVSPSSPLRLSLVSPKVGRLSLVSPKVGVTSVTSSKGRTGTSTEGMWSTAVGETQDDTAGGTMKGSSLRNLSGEMLAKSQSSDNVAPSTQDPVRTLCVLYGFM